MGFPTMAISACYAGPLLSIVYFIWYYSTNKLIKIIYRYGIGCRYFIYLSNMGDRQAI